MKKNKLIVLTFALMMGLTACGGGSNPSSEAPKSLSPSSEVSPTSEAKSSNLPSSSEVKPTIIPSSESSSRPTIPSSSEQAPVIMSSQVPVVMSSQVPVVMSSQVPVVMSSQDPVVISSEPTSSSEQAPSSEPIPTYTELKDINEINEQYLIKAALHDGYQVYGYSIIDDGDTFVFVEENYTDTYNGVVAEMKVTCTGLDRGHATVKIDEVVKTFDEETPTYCYEGLEPATTILPFTANVLEVYVRRNYSVVKEVRVGDQTIYVRLKTDVSTSPLDEHYVRFKGYIFNDVYFYATEYEVIEGVTNLLVEGADDVVNVYATNTVTKLPFTFDTKFIDVKCSTETSNYNVADAYVNDEKDVLTIMGYGQGDCVITLIVGDVRKEINVHVANPQLQGFYYNIPSTTYYVGDVIMPSSITTNPSDYDKSYIPVSDDENIVLVEDDHFLVVGQGNTNIEFKSIYEDKGGYIYYKTGKKAVTTYNSPKTMTYNEIANSNNEHLLALYSAEFYYEEGEYRLYNPTRNEYFAIPSNVNLKASSSSSGVVVYDATNKEFVFVDTLTEANPADYLDYKCSFVIIFEGTGEDRVIKDVAVLPYKSEIQTGITFTTNLSELGLPPQTYSMKGPDGNAKYYLNKPVTLTFDPVEAKLEKVEVIYGNEDPIDITDTLTFVAHRNTKVQVTYSDRGLAKEVLTLNSSSGFKGSRLAARASDEISYTLNGGYLTYSRGVYIKSGKIELERDDSTFNSNYGYTPGFRVFLPSNYRIIGFDIDMDMYDTVVNTMGYGTGTNDSDYESLGSMMVNGSTTYTKASDGYYHFLSNGAATTGNVFSYHFSMMDYSRKSYDTAVSYVKILYLVLPEE